jgi:hypothetical protein
VVFESTAIEGNLADSGSHRSFGNALAEKPRLQHRRFRRASGISTQSCSTVYRSEQSGRGIDKLRIDVPVACGAQPDAALQTADLARMCAVRIRKRFVFLSIAPDLLVCTTTRIAFVN